MEAIGIIYGDVSTKGFNCSLQKMVEKTEFVQMRHETCGWVLGRVEEVFRQSDLSLEKAQLLSTGVPVDVKEQMSAKISLVGYRDERNILCVPHTPFNAGTIIYKADDKFIEEVLGLRQSELTGAYIGLLHKHNSKVFLDINTIVQKHLSILAKTGGGKSYLTAVLLEEFIKHGITALIIDPHGEYSSLKEPSESVQKNGYDVSPRGYNEKILEYSPDVKLNPSAKPLRFTLSNLDARDILWLTNLKNVRTYITPLRKTIEKLRAEKNKYTMEDIINTLERDEEAISGALISELEYLMDVELFVEEGTQISDLIKRGITTIINMRGSPPDIQELIVNRLASAIFKMRKLGKIPPLILVVEEAHNFCPQMGMAASSKILRTIASEGRKFSLGLCVITQRPAKVDKNVLSQCNTQIILKVTNPHDLKAIVSSVEGLTTDMIDEIQNLPVGRAIVTGGGFSVPLLVEVRPRETRNPTESGGIFYK